MHTTPAGWDEVRRIADEIEVQIHLASMDARDRWHALRPRLEKLERSIVYSTEHTEQAIAGELEAVREALIELRDHVYARARGDYVAGW